MAPVGDYVIAYDLMTEVAHRLNASAGRLLDSCDGCGDIGQAVRIWAAGAGRRHDDVASEVAAALARFSELGLTGRQQEFSSPDPPCGATSRAGATWFDSGAQGLVYPVIDHRIAFRSPQPRLLETLDGLLGGGRADVAATLVFAARERPTGAVDLLTDHEWDFPDLATCLAQLTSVFNEYATWTHSCAVLHAAAVRSPDGEVVLLTGASGSGKSTLAGAFIAAGWDYLSDEAVGVRPLTSSAVGYPKPLTLDAESRRVLGLPPGGQHDVDPAALRPDVRRLGGDSGPIERVLFVNHCEVTGTHVEAVRPVDAVIGLLSNTLNASRAGQAALDAVCDLAAFVPAERLSYSDAFRAVDLLTRR